MKIFALAQEKRHQSNWRERQRRPEWGKEKRCESGGKQTVPFGSLVETLSSGGKA